MMDRYIATPCLLLLVFTSFEEHFEGTTMLLRTAIYVDFINKRNWLPLISSTDDGHPANFINNVLAWSASPLFRVCSWLKTALEV